MVIAFVVATKMTTAANAILLQYTGPIYIALLSWPLLGERVRALDWIAVGATVAGMALFFGDALSARGIAGNVVAISSSFGFAAVPLVLRLEQSRMERAGRAREAVLSPTVAIALGNALTVLVALPWMVRTPLATSAAWIAIAAMGVFQIGLPYVLYAIAVRRMRAIESSLIATLEPILSPIWVLVATGERPGNMALVGGAIIVLAVAGQAVSRAPA
jgi:drug/metabolite transporter (DMT)-like permease